MSAEKITIIELAPNQRYRTFHGKRSDKIAAMIEVRKGAEGQVVGYADDLHSPTICTQYGLDFAADPRALLETDLMERPMPGKRMSSSSMAYALQGSGILLSTDESLKDYDEGDVQEEQESRLTGQAQQGVVFDAGKEIKNNDRFDRWTWIFAGVIAVAVLAMAAFALPMLLDMASDITSGVFGGGTDAPVAESADGAASTP